jgi:hypothetical protein
LNPQTNQPQRFLFVASFFLHNGFVFKKFVPRNKNIYFNCAIIIIKIRIRITTPANLGSMVHGAWIKSQAMD